MNHIRNLSLLSLVILLNPSYSVAMQQEETDTDHYAQTDLTPKQQITGQVQLAYTQLKNGISGHNKSNIKFLQTHSEILTQVVGQEQINEDKKKYPLVPKIYEIITNSKTVPAASNTSASSSNRRKSISTTSIEIHTNNNNNNNDTDNAISAATTIITHTSDDSCNSSASSNYYDALTEESTTAVSSSSSSSSKNTKGRRKSMSNRINEENSNPTVLTRALAARIVAEEEKKEANNNNNNDNNDGNHPKAHVHFHPSLAKDEAEKASNSWRCPSPDSSISPTTDITVVSRSEFEAADLRGRNHSEIKMFFETLECRTAIAERSLISSGSTAVRSASSPLEMVAFAKHNNHASSSTAAPATLAPAGSTSSGSANRANTGPTLGTKAAAGFNLGLLAVVIGVLANAK